jgi:hypothetical protein
MHEFMLPYTKFTELIGLVKKIPRLKNTFSLEINVLNIIF